MNIRNIIAENALAVFLKMLPDNIKTAWQFAKNNARCNNSKSESKSLTDILMLTHALEKAFSLPNPRKSFGLQKAISLLDKTERYIAKFGWNDSMTVPVSVLKEYISYHERSSAKSPEITTLERHLDKIVSSAMHSDTFNSGGAISVSGKDLTEHGHGNFEELASNRYSIRNFSSAAVSDEIVYKALDIAKKSPSACNRQAYRVHVFKGALKNALLKMQGGANSFYATADKVLMICADANRYYTREPRLGYVDASLFTMSLIYAFTYLGVGSIPLTLGIDQHTLDKMKRDFDIPANEIPVVLVAVGNYQEKFEVAMSHRNPVESFSKFH